MNNQDSLSYQSLIFEAVVDRSDEQPEGPKVFKPGEQKCQNNRSVLEYELRTETPRDNQLPGPESIRRGV